MIDFERVVRDAAIKNNLAIRKDDPVMLLATTINIMLDDLDASMNKALDAYKSGHEDIARRWRGDAEASAAKILNAALDAGREAAAAAINEGAQKMVGVIREELTSVILHQKVELETSVHEIRRSAFFMLFVSGAMLVASIFMSMW